MDSKNRGLWNRSVEEYYNDLERRRAVYACGETIARKSFTGKHFLKDVYVLLPFPLPKSLGPLGWYSKKIRLLTIKNVHSKKVPFRDPKEKFFFPFYSWRLAPEGQCLVERSPYLRTRFQKTVGQMTRHSYHNEKYLRKLFCSSGIASVLTLALASFLSHYFLKRLDIFHLYSAVLLSGKVLRQLKKSLSKVARSIKRDLVIHLQNLVAQKKRLNLSHLEELKALQVIQSNDLVDILMHESTSVGNKILKKVLKENIEYGPHYFFGLKWNRIPFNKLLLAFIKLKPTDTTDLACNLVLNRKDSKAGHSLSHLHLTESLSPEQPNFFCDYLPATNRLIIQPCIASKVIIFKPSYLPTKRNLNWEETLVLTYTLPKKSKKRIIKFKQENDEFYRINYPVEINQTDVYRVPIEEIQLWKNSRMNTIQKIPKMGSIHNELMNTNKEEICSSNTISDIDLRGLSFNTVSNILDNLPEKLETLSDSNESFYNSNEIITECDSEKFSVLMEDLVLEDLELYLLEQEAHNDSDIFDDKDKVEDSESLSTAASEAEGEEHEDRYDEEWEEIEEEEDFSLLEWIEEHSNIAQEIVFEMTTWNPLWRLKPFNISPLETDEDSASLTSPDLNHYQESSVFSVFAEPSEITTPEKDTYKIKSKWTNLPRTSPYWLISAWKKVLWIKWREKEAFWLVNTLRKVEYLLLKKKFRKNLVKETKKQEEDDDEIIEEEELSEITEEHSILTSSITSFNKNNEVSSSNIVTANSPLKTSSPSLSSPSQRSSEKSLSWTIFSSESYSAPPLHETPSFISDISDDLDTLEMYSREFARKNEMLINALDKEALLTMPLGQCHKLHICDLINDLIEMGLDDYQQTPQLSYMSSTISQTSSTPSRKSWKSSTSIGTAKRFPKKMEFSSSGGLSPYRGLLNFIETCEERIRGALPMRYFVPGNMRRLSTAQELMQKLLLDEAESISIFTEKLGLLLSIPKKTASLEDNITNKENMESMSKIFEYYSLWRRIKQVRSQVHDTIENMFRLLRRRKIIRYSSSQTDVSSKSSDTDMSLGFSFASSITETDSNVVIFEENELETRWPRKRDWPRRKYKSKICEEPKLYWPDTQLIEFWERKRSDLNHKNPKTNKASSRIYDTHEEKKLKTKTYLKTDYDGL